MAYVRRRGARICTWLGLTVYALILAVSPVLHHDLACHVKSPTHCEACTANPLASRVETAVLTVHTTLPLVGEVAPAAHRVDAADPVRIAAGRAPPA
jgi:hypothetical protein